MSEDAASTPLNTVDPGSNRVVYMVTGISLILFMMFAIIFFVPGMRDIWALAMLGPIALILYVMTGAYIVVYTRIERYALSDTARRIGYGHGFVAALSMMYFLIFT